MTRYQGIAHIVAGDAGDIPRVVALLASAGFAAESPDLYARSYASFGVDEAREIVARAAAKAIEAPHRAFVIAAPNMTAEAQNALLKTLEEAPGGAAFFLIVPSPDMLLATVRSRSIPLSLPAVAMIDGRVDIAAFLAAAPAARIEMLKVILDADERDLAGAYALLAGLERALSSRAVEPAVRDGLDAVYRARRYAGDKGSLLKPLLEHVALLLPSHS